MYSIIEGSFKNYIENHLVSYSLNESMRVHRAHRVQLKITTIYFTAWTHDKGKITV